MPLRRFGTITESGDSLPWLQECRNKKSVTLDMRKPEGAAILKRLVAKADVLVENFQPGTLEKWGLGWDVLKKQNPRLVMVRISGFGQTGPYSPRPGFGRIGNAFGGLSYPRGLSRPAAGDARLGHHSRLHGGALRRARRHVRAARPRHDRARAVHRHRPLRADLPHPRRAGRRPTTTRATCASAWGPAPSTSCRTATTRPRTASGSPSPALTTRSSRAWPSCRASRAGRRRQVGQGRGPGARSRRGRRLGHAVDPDVHRSRS